MVTVIVVVLLKVRLVGIHILLAVLLVSVLTLSMELTVVASIVFTVNSTYI